MRQTKAMKETKMEGGNPVPETSSQETQSAGDETPAETPEGFAPFSGGKRKTMRKSMRKHKGKSMRKHKGKSMRKHKGKSMRKYKKKGGFISAEVATPLLFLTANTMVKKNSTRKQKK